MQGNRTVTGQGDGEVIPDIAFTPYRSPLTDCLKQNVAEIAKQVEGYEHYHKIRKRKRRPEDKVIFEETVSAIVCDLMYNYLRSPEQKVFMGLSHQTLGTKSRYRPRCLGKKFPHVLEALSSIDLGFVGMVKGKQRARWVEDENGQYRITGKQTTVWPKQKLIARIERSGIALSDFGRSESEEVIHLKRSKRDLNDRGELVEYSDNDITRKYREKVRTINRWLATANLTVLNNEVDPHDRHLRRIFNNGRFDQGGRIYGGFWQTMKSEQRSSGIRIDDSPIAELDYGQMLLRLCYGKVGKQPPPGDLYEVPGLSDRGVDRKGIKQVINAAMFARTPLTRLPKGSRQYFPMEIGFGQTFQAISRYHKPIAHLLFSAVGMTLMHLESEILVSNLLDLISKRVTSLPIHDALLVPCSRIEVARKVMLDNFESMGGVTGKVNVDKG